jgi:hypothetical protein
MFTIIAITVASVLIVFFFKGRRYVFKHPELTFWLAVCAGFPAIVVGFIVAALIGAFLVPIHQVTYGPARLAAMRSADGVEGTFIWGSGSISSNVVYSYYTAESDGSLAPHQMPADDVVRIVEDPNLKGEGFWTTTTSEADYSSPFAPWAIGLGDRYTTLRQEFRVPRGTVISQFKVN